MNEIADLIADMAIKDAPESELKRAIDHSIIVIDAEKSYLVNGIEELKTKYEGDNKQ